MNVFAMLSPTDFFSLAEEILGHRQYVKELVSYYQNNPGKIKLWLQELDQAIVLFNRQAKFSPLYINAIYLKSVLTNPLQSVDQVIQQTDLFRPTLEAMNNFEFFDDKWEIESLAAACIIAFYRTFVLTTQPDLKVKKVQVASVIEEMLAMMALNGKKTELFQAIKFWLEDWENEGFSQQLAIKVKSLQGLSLQVDRL